MTTTFILGEGETFVQCPYNTSHRITNARFLFHLKKCREDFLKKLTDKEKKDAMRICRHNRLHHKPEPEMKLHEDKYCPDAHNVLSFVTYHNSEEGAKQYQEIQKLKAELEQERNREHFPTPQKYPHYKEKSRDKRNRHYNARANGRPAPGPSTNGYDDDADAEQVEQKYDPHQQQQTDQSTNQIYDLPEEDWEAECSELGDKPAYDPSIKLKNETIIYNPQGMTKSERKKFREKVKAKAIERDGHRRSREEALNSNNNAASAEVKIDIDLSDCEEIDYSKSEEPIPSSSRSYSATDTSAPKKNGAIADSNGIFHTVTKPSISYSYSRKMKASTSSRRNPHSSSSSSSTSSFSRRSRTAGVAARSSSSRHDRNRRRKRSKSPSKQDSESDDFAGFDPYGNSN